MVVVSTKVVRPDSAGDEKLRTEQPKFALIQAGRGLAALWVVFFHIKKGALLTGLTAVLPVWLTTALFDYGSAGVAVFFVISGFVIAHSLSNVTMSGTRFYQFIIKRSIRLDPVYWVSIAITIAVAAILAWVHKTPFALPSLKTIGMHVLYIQEIVRAPEINIVYWTLTYEIQFYAVFAAATWAATVLARRSELIANIVVVGPLCVLAFVAAVAPDGLFPKGVFANYWHGFFVGVLAYYSGYMRRNAALLLALSVTMLITSTWKSQIFNAPCACTAIILYMSARGTFLVNGLRQPIFQILGRFSYSLYLIHGSIIVALGGAWGRVAGRGLVADAGALVFLISLSVLAAAIMWWAIERPTHKIASNIFNPKDRLREQEIHISKVNE